MTMKEYRTKLGLGYKDMIRHNIYPPNYYKYETGQQKLGNLNLETAVLYASFFGFDDPEQLLDFDDPTTL